MLGFVWHRLHCQIHQSWGWLSGWLVGWLTGLCLQIFGFNGALYLPFRWSINANFAVCVLLSHVLMDNICSSVVLSKFFANKWWICCIFINSESEWHCSLRVICQYVCVPAGGGCGGVSGGVSGGDWTIWLICWYKTYNKYYTIMNVACGCRSTG